MNELTQYVTQGGNGRRDELRAKVEQALAEGWTSKQILDALTTGLPDGVAYGLFVKRLDDQLLSDTSPTRRREREQALNAAARHARMVPESEQAHWEPGRLRAEMLRVRDGLRQEVAQ